MWLAWRARARRDAPEGVIAGSLDVAPLTGEVIAEFPRASYVSTTPAGAPLERVSMPGLRYKGFADVVLRRDGVLIAVTGEKPVLIPADHVIGSTTAGSRIGKTVERDGLSLLRWRSENRAGQQRELESSFRLADAREQHRFADAISVVAGATQTENPSTPQEDA
nr:hypothetical protein [Leucobacter edaphi]